MARILGARANVHPPVFFALEHGWIRLAGESEYSLRLPNALLSVAVVPAAWYLGWRLGGAPTGLLAASLAALAPVGLHYAREARMYGMLMAEGAVVLAAADRLARKPTGSRWATYAVAGLLASLTHWTGLAALGAGALRVLALARTAAFGPWLSVHAALAFLVGGWGLLFWANRDAWAGLVWLPWAGRTGLQEQLVDWASSIAGTPVGPATLEVARTTGHTESLVLSAALLAVALVGALACLAPGRRLLGLSVLALGTGPLLAIVLLEPIRPMWHVRFTLIGLPAILVLAAVGATAMRGRLAAAALPLAVLVLAPVSHGLLWPRSGVHEDWKAVAAELRRAGPSDQVLLGGLEILARYYFSPILPVRQRPVALNRSAEETVAELNDAVGSARGVWVVPARDALLDPNDVVVSTLERYATGREERTVGNVPLLFLELRPRERIALSGQLQPVDARYGDSIRLVAYGAERHTIGDQATVRVSLDVLIERRQPEDLKVFAHLLDREGKTVAQRDVVLLDSSHRPTSQMPDGTRLRFDLPIGGSQDLIQSGRAVGIGVYQLGGEGRRLPLSPPAAEHRLVLAVD